MLAQALLPSASTGDRQDASLLGCACKRLWHIAASTDERQLDLFFAC